MSSLEVNESNNYFDIAVIGMSCRFPGANNITDYWENLCNGKESISFFSDEELLESGVDSELLKDPNYVKARGIVDDIDKFDAAFFNFFPKEVEILDPQQRLFLECTWEALEDAGCISDNYNGIIGIWGGVGMNTYLLPYLKQRPKSISTAEGYQMSIGNEKDFLTTRVSYKLNLKGPSIDIQTACSTSLVAIHNACLNLLNYQCDVAIAGGSTVFIPQKSGYLYQEGMILSPDGHCRPFDNEARGTLGSNGCGIVVLKRLSDAVKEHDHIYAVIKGTACNNDGADRVGYTAPGIDGQTQVIATALSVANINPESIQYVEAHGTGTIIGDPIEVSALTRVYREFTQEKNYCAIGSVKSNIGHLDAASGVAGFIKTVLSLHHKKIPPSINFKSNNSKVDFKNSPFYVVNELKDWQSNDAPRRAAVSSFGIGGTNSHVILEEAPVFGKSNPVKKSAQLLVWSAKNQTSLTNQKRKLSRYMKQSEQALENVAFTLQTGRKEFNCREAIVSESLEDALEKLSPDNLKHVISGKLSADAQSPKVAFMFSGQGSQYVGMGKGIYENESKYREIIDYCSDYLKPLLDLDLRDILFAGDLKTEAADFINKTYITQPALFVTEYALAKLLISWGITPGVMMGHSIGEYTACCLSGVISLDDALKLVALRGKLMQKMPEGGMLGVSMPESEVLKIINGSVSIAAVNSPGFVTLSGPFEGIQKTEQILKERSIEFRRLHTSHAFHSRMMDPILEEFECEVRKVRLNAPSIPYLSNLSGKLISEQEAKDPAYYSRHLRQTVRFSENLQEVMKENNVVLLEVGPGNTLTSFAKNHSGLPLGNIISTMRHPKETKNDYSCLLSALGRLWVNGLKVDWTAFHEDESLYKISLPAYSFDRKRYWLEVKDSSQNIKAKDEIDKNEVEEWFYIPSWKRKNIMIKPSDEKKRWLILAAKDETIDDFIKEELIRNDQQVLIAFSGRGFKKIDDYSFVIDSYNEEDYKKLFAALNEDDLIPDNIVILWNVSGNDYDELNAIEKQEDPYLGYFSLVNLAKAIDEVKAKNRINIFTVTLNMFGVTDLEFSLPEMRTISGPCQVIQQEYPNIRCKLLDLENTNYNESLISSIITEAMNEDDDQVIAYRGKYKWVQSFEKIRYSNRPGFGESMLRINGVYLITGGLGRIGSRLTEMLSKEYSARIIITTRKHFPSKKRWTHWLQTHVADDPVSQKIRQFREMESYGADIMVLKADVSSIKEMREAVDIIIETYGELNGVFHMAGILGEKAFRLISELTPQDFEEQIKPKIEGVKVLKEVLKRKKADFVVLQSSLSTVLGGIGFTAYSAANSFMDAFVLRANKSTNTKWISVAWDGWKFDDDLSGTASLLNHHLIMPEDGKKAFKLILSEFLYPRIIVSIEDIDKRTSKLRTGFTGTGFTGFTGFTGCSGSGLSGAGFDNEHKSDETETILESDRPEISTEYIEPANDLEREIRAIWQNLLGINKIGRNDSFFDLGGNSLLGTQLITKLRQNFNCELPIKLLFDDPTISGIAAVIESQKPEISHNISRVDELLKQVSKLSDEEVLKLLKQKNGNG